MQNEELDLLTAEPSPFGSAWRPSAQQEWLLRASLWEGEDGRNAWNEWIGQVDIQNLDPGSYRLLPLLYLNLRALGVEHPELERIHGVYRYHWYRNQLLMRRATIALTTLHEHKIPTMLLKACALIPLYYKNPAARPMDDVDVLVPTERAREAMQVLEKIGWNPWFGPVSEYSNQFLERHYAHTMRDKDGFTLDLHRHMMYMDTRQDADVDFWASAITFEFEGIETHALHPSDQLLHLCAHGSVWNPISPIRWAADAMVLLRNATVDWDRFAAQAAKRDLVLAARSEIEYLKTALRAPVPDKVMDALHTLPVSAFDRLQYRVNLLPYTKRGGVEKLWYHYEHYRRYGSVYKDENVLLRFPAFLRDTWGLKKTRDVPGHMARYVLRKLGLPTTKNHTNRAILEDEK